MFREELLSSLFDIPRGFTKLVTDVLPARRPLGLDRRRNGSVCKNTADITAALEVDVLILSFRLDIRSLLRRMIGGKRTLSPLSTAELGSNAPDVFSLLDNRLLLRGATLAGNSGDIVGSES